MNKNDLFEAQKKALAHALEEANRHWEEKGSLDETLCAFRLSYEQRMVNYGWGWAKTKTDDEPSYGDPEKSEGAAGY